MAMRRLPSLSTLRAFEAAARHGSFKRAAMELAVTPTAISHQIRQLEEQTGLRLFNREVRKVVLTEAGAQVYPVLRDGFDAFQAVFETLAQAKRRPQVTISATVAFTSRWLVPKVSEFQARHPQIDLHLHASDEIVDLAASGIDLAIRYGRGPYPGMAVEPMFADQYAPVISPALGITAPEDLAKVPLIHFRWRWNHPLNPTWNQWFASAELEQPVSSAQLRFSDESHAIQAAVAGQGAALLSLALVESEMDAGHLVQPFGPSIAGHTYHIVQRSDRDAGAHVQAAADWLRSQVSRTASKRMRSPSR